VKRLALVAALVVAVLVPVGADAAAPLAAVTALGSARAEGAPATPDVVGLAPTTTGGGYWVASADGAVSAHGDASPLGRATGLNAPIVAIAASPLGGGYWLAAADGGIFTFGTAGYHGSLGGRRLNAPIVAVAATPSGMGYWLAASDGGIFTFGDARFFGSTGALRLHRPIVAVAATPTGRGYWLAASDGGVFTFGDAAFAGSLGGRALAAPIVGMAATSSGRGYWLAGADGAVFTLGDAPFEGTATLPAGHRAVAFAAHPGGRAYWIASTRDRPVTVAAMGDVHGEGRVRTLLARGGNPLDAVAPTLRAADVAMVNLETPVGTTGAPEAKQHVFQAPPSLLVALKAVGVDVVNLANNHARDHGVAGLLETRDRARAAGLQPVGAGADAAEAWAPAIVRTPAGPVAVVGMSRVLPSSTWAARADAPGIASAYDEAAAVAAVRRAAQLADHVVVLVHWGVELAACPDAAQRHLADALVAAGADVVAGHHPHVLEAVDQRPGAVVAYSLGNAVWYHSRPPSDLTAILTASLSGGRVVGSAVLPARIDAGGHPRLLGSDESARVRTDLQRLRPGRGRC
jgi:poly-gamma-glutamate capsule biosynthesis protein CapA/YwtB (metallophosphatase superfamily)